MKNCDLNTCSDLYSSMCVLYTGELISGTYITLTGCNPNLNEYLNQVDILLKAIKDNENILISTVRSTNCGFTKIDDMLNNPSNIDGLKVRSSATILTLLQIICDLQTEINDLKNGGIFDLPLPDSIKDNLKCLSGIIIDPCDGPIKIETLKDLLLQLINKACE